MFIGGNEDPKNIAIDYFQSGVEKFLDGLQDAAKSDFFLALEFDPTLVLAHCYLSSIYTENGDHETGLAICEKGLELEPNNENLRFCRGCALDEKGMKKEAVEDYHYYFDKHKDDSECAFSIACAYDDLNNFDGARNYYNLTIQLEPEHFKAYFNWSLLEGALGNEGEAIRLLKHCISINGDYWKGWVKLGVFNSKAGNIEVAVEAYKQALKRNTSLIDVYYNLGISYRLLDRHNEAAKAFTEVVKKSPEDISAWHNLGVTFYDMKDFDMAIDAFHNAISLNLNHAEAHYRLGCVYIAKGDMGKAKKEMEFLKNVKEDYYHSLSKTYQEAFS